MSDMRASIWPGLIQTLSYNLARQQSRVRLFESGLTFIRRDGEIEQHPKLAGLFFGEATTEQWGVAARKVDFYDIKADVESVLAQVADPAEFRFEAAEHPALHPGQSAQILRNGEAVGWMGLLHPVAQKALDVPGGVYLFELDLVPMQMGGIPAFAALSKFPAIRRDFALVVDRDLPYQAVLDVVRDAAPAVVKDVQLFDVYTGENIDSGLKSLALSLILQESSHTLTDQEVEQASAVVLAGTGGTPCSETEGLRYMALTKAEMAEHLFEELGLNKREAKDMVEMFFEEIRMSLGERSSRSSCPVSATSICATRSSAPDATPRPAKRSRSRHVAW